MIAVAVRVHQLAAEFGVTSKVILVALGEMGEYVKSASSVVEPPVVHRLRERLRAQEATVPEVHPAPRRGSGPGGRRPGNNPFSRAQGTGRRGRVTDPALLEAAEVLGVPPESLRPAPKPRKKSVERKSGTHEMDEWDLRLIDRKERQQWLDAGLGEHDARVADDCKRFGIAPEDLSLVVERRAVWDRLRSNEPIAVIADMVKVAKRGQQNTG